MKSHDPADFKLKVDPRDGALTGNYGYTHLDVCFVVHERAHPIDRHGCPVKFVVGFHWPASNGKRSTIDRAKPRSGQSREPRLASPNGMLTLRSPEAGERAGAPRLAETSNVQTSRCHGLMGRWQRGANAAGTAIGRMRGHGGAGNDHPLRPGDAHGARRSACCQIATCGTCLLSLWAARPQPAGAVHRCTRPTPAARCRRLALGQSSRRRRP